MMSNKPTSNIMNYVFKSEFNQFNSFSKTVEALYCRFTKFNRPAIINNYYFLITINLIACSNDRGNRITF